MESLRNNFNLSKSEQNGLKSFCNRLKAGEIVVASSDKSNRFVVLEKSQYIQSGTKHTANDQVIRDNEIVKIQTILNSHTSWLTDIFKMSSRWRQGDRMHKNITEKGEQTCPMICLIKDHKGWEYSPETPFPPSRPVIAGNMGINRCIDRIDRIEEGKPIRLPGTGACKKTDSSDPQDAGFVIVGSDVEPEAIRRCKTG